MGTNDFAPVFERTEPHNPVLIAEKTAFCMKQYQPYLRNDFNLHHLSLIINVPLTELEKYFSQSDLNFVRYLDQWRAKHAKNLMDHEKYRNLDVKTIGSLSGFSTIKKFNEAFTGMEGITPETYQAKINKSSSI